ncbi:MAG TPA: 50S ribosomal protein L32e [Candidatus Thermoplasmatota archaeon]|nr:50S ribosomal protein L32e [Candidatus Thermoplasmatota archaeon]
MSKEDFVKQVTQLPGVGKATAEKLYDAGFTTMEKLKAASEADLTAAGVTGKAAQAVLAGVKEGTAAPADQIAVKEGKKGKAVEIVEAGQKAKGPKIKPTLPAEIQAALKLRAEKLAKEPGFKRYHWWYKDSLTRKDAWRRPQGAPNGQRKHLGQRPPMVKIGYGKPAITRGLHSSGFLEVLVYNPRDLEQIDPKIQAARIGGAVGGKKRADIEAAAATKGIRVLNPRRT